MRLTLWSISPTYCTLHFRESKKNFHIRPDISHRLTLGRDVQIWVRGQISECLAGYYNQSILLSAISNLISLSGMFSQLTPGWIISRVLKLVRPAISYLQLELSRQSKTLSEYISGNINGLTANSPLGKIYYAGFRFFITFQSWCNH